MKNDEKNFINYFFMTYINSLIFNHEDKKILKNDINLFSDPDFINSLVNKLKIMKDGPSYPTEVIKRIRIIIDEVSKYTDSSTNEIIQNEYIELKSKKHNGDIYLNEYVKRFMEPSDVLLPTMYIEKGDINNSILFDFATLYSLINPKQEININEYYLYSIKNFLCEYPEMFLDKLVNKRALEIINKQEESELKERLSYKIKNINKFKNKQIDYYNIRGTYKYILLQNMLIDKEILKENESDIFNLLEQLKDIIDNDLIDDEYERKNAHELLDYCKEQANSLSKEEKAIVFDEINEYIIKLNLLEFKKEKMISELFIRFGRYRLKEAYNNIENVDILIHNDLKVMQYLLNGKDNGLYIEDAYLSIRKLLFLCPTLFDDYKVYERASELLIFCDNKNELRKIKKIYKG